MQRTTPESAACVGIDPYAVSAANAADNLDGRGRRPLLFDTFVRAARGAARTALIVALTVSGVFAFAGALFAALDIWFYGVLIGVVSGGVAWLLDLFWLWFRLTMTERASVSG